MRHVAGRFGSRGPGGRFGGTSGRFGGFGGRFGGGGGHFGGFGGSGYSPGGFGGFQVTPWVKRLLAANAAVFLVVLVVGVVPMADLFGFSPGRILKRPWGMLTYMFVHAGLFHLLMNLLVVFFFGPPLESRWGSELFLKYYLMCGLGGVLLSFAFSDATIVGASAACYGLMLAFAMAWPNAPIHIWGIVPVKAKWLVGFLAAMSLASALGSAGRGGGGDNIAHLAHLGGVVAGFLLLKSGWMDASGWTPTGPRTDASPQARTGPRTRTGPQTRKGPRTRLTGRGDDPRQQKSPAPSRVAEALERRKAEKRAARERADLDAVDAVLDKISAQGMGSLTDEERALLNRMSKRTRAN